MIKFKDWLSKRHKEVINENIDENFIFFFVHKGDLFACDELNRVTYAKMIDKDDEDHTEGWLKEANFGATNLYKKEGNQSIFSYKDVKDIHVIDKERALKLLEKHAATNQK